MSAGPLPRQQHQSGSDVPPKGSFWQIRRFRRLGFYTGIYIASACAAYTYANIAYVEALPSPLRPPGPRPSPLPSPRRFRPPLVPSLSLPSTSFPPFSPPPPLSPTFERMFRWWLRLQRVVIFSIRLKNLSPLLRTPLLPHPSPALERTSLWWLRLTAGVHRSSQEFPVQPPLLCSFSSLFLLSSSSSSFFFPFQLYQRALGNVFEESDWGRLEFTIPLLLTSPLLFLFFFFSLASLFFRAFQLHQRALGNVFEESDWGSLDFTIQHLSFFLLF
ncbi:unnamed protein product [Closterium sp. NIES-53]